jgi:microcystin-dependent protein
MNYTTNLNLNKPEKAEQFNIDHWNDNMDTIDTAVQGEIDTRTSQVQTLTQNLGDEVTARQNGVEDAKNLANATGTLAVAKGGTGMTTDQAALENLCASVPSPSSLETTDNILFMRSTNVKKIDMDTVATKVYDLIFNRIQTTIPTGVIYPFCGEFGIVNDPYVNVPAGYLACDGQAVSRTTYKNLFAIIGTKYGNGDEITTFNVPDLREAVMVGAGQSTRAILDTTGHAHDIYTLGEFKDDQIQNITGSLVVANGNNRNIASGAFDVGDYASSDQNIGTSGNAVHHAKYTLDASTVARTGTTTHQKSLGVNYIIKY